MTHVGPLKQFFPLDVYSTIQPGIDCNNFEEVCYSLVLWPFSFAISDFCPRETYNMMIAPLELVSDTLSERFDIF